MFLEHEEELERLCYEEPANVITTQIELLTQRIDRLRADEQIVEASGTSSGNPRPGVRAAGATGVPGMATHRAERSAASEQSLETSLPQAAPLQESWEEVFDRAMQGKREWKRNRAQAAAAAVRPAPSPVVLEAAVVPAAPDLKAQLAAERQRLAGLLQRFEKVQQRIWMQEQQPIIDHVEQLRAEQRAAMDAKGEELRRAQRAEEWRREVEAEERRRQAEEAQRREAEERQQREADERQRRREAEALQRRRGEEAEQRRRREEEAEQRRRQEEAERRSREEAERRSREEAEQRRRQEARERQQVSAQRTARHTAQFAAFDQLEAACSTPPLEEDGARQTARHAAQFAAFDRLEVACSTPPLEEENAWHTVRNAAQPPAKSTGSGPDFLSRAMAALGESSSSESSGEETAATATATGDADLLRLSGAIARKIEGLHMG